MLKHFCSCHMQVTSVKYSKVFWLSITLYTAEPSLPSPLHSSSSLWPFGNTYGLPSIYIYFPLASLEDKNQATRSGITRTAQAAPGTAEVQAFGESPWCCPSEPKGRKQTAVQSFMQVRLHNWAPIRHCFFVPCSKWAFHQTNILLPATSDSIHQQLLVSTRHSLHPPAVTKHTHRAPSPHPAPRSTPISHWFS